MKGHKNFSEKKILEYKEKFVRCLNFKCTEKAILSIISLEDISKRATGALSDLAFLQGSLITQDTNSRINSSTMAIDKEKSDFLKMAASQIGKNYSGDPLALQPFLNAIALLKTFAGAAHAELLKQFLLTKIEGKALECLPTNPQNIDAITDALKQFIKPANLDVITGRIHALRADRNNMQDRGRGNRGNRGGGAQNVYVAQENRQAPPSGANQTSMNQADN